MKKLGLALLFFLATATTSWANLADMPLVDQRPDVRAYINEMVKIYQFNKAELTALFNTIKAVPIKVLPFGSRPIIHQMQGKHDFIAWYHYQHYFITPEVIDQGVVYWKKNQHWLQKATQLYGIPPSIIVATIGMESKYGQQMGKYSVFKTLAVLAFDYGPRKAYFSKELTAFLLYCRNNHLDTLGINGSYAGAIGEPQFMPSNISSLAVDFDGKGNIDLSHDDADAIGSVGHFYKMNHWQPTKPIATPVVLKKSRAKNWLAQNPTAKMSIAEFAKYGIFPADKTINKHEIATLVVLESQQGPEYWLTFCNFRVLKSYNNSTDYAMALYQLSQRIEAHYHQDLAHVAQQQQAGQASHHRKTMPMRKHEYSKPATSSPP